MYKAIIYFTDLRDNSHPYNPGDVFPRDGLVVDNERLDELSSDANLRGVPLIAWEDDPVEPVKEEVAPKRRKRK